ncbi:hypothetical protein INR49_011719, partial [Caranx melampygus]
VRRHTHTHTCQSTHLPEVALSTLRLQAAIQMSLCMGSHFCLLVLPVMSLLLLLSPIGWSYDGLTPGCHLHPFNVTIRSDRRSTCKGTHLVYACVGYCESSAFPSRYSVLVASNFTHNITSASQCCTISKDAKVKVRLDCPRGRHQDEIEILTAKAYGTVAVQSHGIVVERGDVGLAARQPGRHVAGAAVWQRPQQASVVMRSPLQPGFWATKENSRTAHPRKPWSEVVTVTHTTAALATRRRRQERDRGWRGMLGEDGERLHGAELSVIIHSRLSLLNCHGDVSGAIM